MVFFEQLSIILAASLFATLICNRLKMPSLLAYIVVGAVLGPYGFGVVQYSKDFAFLAELGVVFLLFSLGLEFSFKQLKRIKVIVFGVGTLQVVICSIAFFIALTLWGSSTGASLIMAGAIALSSTAIVSKDITSKGTSATRESQLAIGVLLFQDIVALLFLILIPVLAASQEAPFMDEFLATFLKAAVLIAILVGVGLWVLPLVYKEINRFGSDEAFVLTTLVIALLAAWLTHELALSMALGGFIIGMMLGENDFKRQIESDLKPFKSILLGLFFVTLGMQLESSLLFEYWPRILLFTAVLLIVKCVLISLLLMVLKESKPAALSTGLMLSQAGEFGLALLAMGNSQGLIPHDQASFMILICVMSMVVSVVIIHFQAAIIQKMFGSQA